MFRGQTVSLVIPAYNEEVTIAAVVEEFRAEVLIDEIVVVDNNCTDATAERATAVGARVVQESTPGYGSALRAGMDACFEKPFRAEIMQQIARQWLADTPQAHPRLKRNEPLAALNASGDRPPRPGAFPQGPSGRGRA